MSRSENDWTRHWMLAEEMTQEQLEILHAWLERQSEKMHMPPPERFDGDRTFTVRHITRGGRRHTVVEPPRSPDFWYVEPLPKELGKEPPIDWLRVSSVLTMLFSEMYLPYVVIDGVRVSRCWEEKVEPRLSELTDALFDIQDLLNEGHEDDRAYIRKVDDLVVLASDRAMDYADAMSEIAFREGVRLGQKLRPEDFADWEKDLSGGKVTADCVKVEPGHAQP